jgi:hypothetical protein
MTAIDRQIAQQVADTLIAAELTIPSFGEPYTADQITVDYLPRTDATQIARSAKIYVSPRARTLTPNSRNQQRREHTVQVCVMQQARPDSELFIELMDLVHTMEDTLAKAHQIPALRPIQRHATFVGSQCDLYDLNDLETKSIFRSVLTLTYITNK